MNKLYQHGILNPIHKHFQNIYLKFLRKPKDKIKNNFIKEF